MIALLSSGEFLTSRELRDIEFARYVRIAIIPRSRLVFPVPIYVYDKIARAWRDSRHGLSNAKSIIFW